MEMMLLAVIGLTTRLCWGGTNLINGEAGFDIVSYDSVSDLRVALDITGFQNTGASIDRIRNVEGINLARYDTQQAMDQTIGLTLAKETTFWS